MPDGKINKWRFAMTFKVVPGVVMNNFLESKGDSAFPWISAQPLSEPLLNMHKCPKRGLMTTGGQIPIEKHYHSLRVLN